MKHRLAAAKKVTEEALAGELLILADGHCLASQVLAACGARRSVPGTGLHGAMQASTLETLVNLVAAGYGTTLLPALAADSFRGREIVLLPLAGKSTRTIRLASRPGFPRPQTLRALEKVVRKAVNNCLNKS
jgi:LysR family transcriptional regulator, hydrogen peroxide-inducible genes activator